jgi:hypothetical protein
MCINIGAVVISCGCPLWLYLMFFKMFVIFINVNTQFSSMSIFALCEKYCSFLPLQSKIERRGYTLQDRLEDLLTVDSSCIALTS